MVTARDEGTDLSPAFGIVLGLALGAVLQVGLYLGLRMLAGALGG